MNLRLYLADYFDTLANGKQIAVGMYPDLVVVMNLPPDVPKPTPEVPFGTDMGMLLTISGLPVGPHEGATRVLPPGLEDRPVIDVRFNCAVNQPGSAVNVALQFRPLLMPAIGTYTVQVHIGGEELTAQFEVRIHPISAATGLLLPLMALTAGETQTPAAKPRRKRAASKPG